jgi:superfamily II DNA or RNA helicase
MYSIPVSSFGAEELEEEKERLTIQARTSFGRPPPPFKAWHIKDDILHVPVFYGFSRFGRPLYDDRVLGEEIDVCFSGQLTEPQVKASVAAFGNQLGPEGEGGALICLPCGYGKTVWAVHAIVNLKRKACILVHKAFLRDQWVAAFQQFCPGIRIGYIQGKQWVVDNCDVVIAFVMTIAKRSYNVGVMDCFGTICFDECHHMAAPIMNAATQAFRPRYIIGLTATKDRPDGLTPLLHWSLGPEAFRIEREGEKVSVSIALFSNGTPEILNKDGQPMMSIMITNLANNVQRNLFIANRIVALREKGRVILVLSDRLAQLTTLRGMVLSLGVADDEVGLFTGSTKESDRGAQLSRGIVMCSYGMANEGLDKREADTCIMATPKGRVTQCIGRIQRPCDTKKPPLVLDVADDVSVFVPLRWKRQKLYGKEKYNVQVLRARMGGCVEKEEWFE